MKHLSLFFTCLTLIFAGNNSFAQFNQAQLVGEWQRAKAYTKEYLDAMPTDGYNFKPTPEIRSFAQQMLHIADANYMFGAVGSGKPSPLGQTVADHTQLGKTIEQTKEATTKAVIDSYDWVINTLQNMTPAQLTESIKFASHDITRMGMFGKCFEHQTHHRGQTTIYLRLKGITPPAGKLF